MKPAADLIERLRKFDLNNHFDEEARTLIAETREHLEKQGKIIKQGSEMIRSRGYQIRGMFDALGDKARQIKTLYRHLAFYRDHVLDQVDRLLLEIDEGDDLGDYDSACAQVKLLCAQAIHIREVISQRRKPASARAAVAEMERNSSAYRRKLKNIEAKA